MKILLIASHFPPMVGGAPVVYENICAHLKGEVAVLASMRRYSDGTEITGWKEFDTAQAYHVQRVDLLQPLVKPPANNMVTSLRRLFFEDIPFFKRIAKAVIQAVDTVGADAVCMGDLQSLFWLGPYLKWKRHLPVIQYVHGEEITTDWGSRLYKKGNLWALQRADRIVTVSSFTKAAMTVKGIASDKIEIITNGVDLERYSPGPEAAEILERHSLAGQRVLLTVGRLQEARKGHDHVIRALPQILKAIPNAVYLIVGTGGYQEKLKQLAKELGVEEKVIFAGFISWDELPLYYRSCDLFVMPNRTLPDGNTEGFGLVFLEANACGKPVVGGNAGGVTDAVVDGETGLLVDGNSVTEIAEAVIRILRNEDLAAHLGKQGYQRALEYSWENKAAQFRSACGSLVKHS